MKVSRRLPLLCRPLLFALIAMGLAYLPLGAAAACSDSKVKRLSQQGKTVSAIAKSCDMATEDVRGILDEDEEEDEPAPTPRRRPDKGLAPGTPLAQCACWGYASPGQRQPSPACASGFAVPRMCPQVCPLGGYAWQGVCG